MNVVAQVLMGEQKPQQPAPPKVRPLGITILAILSFIGGAIFILEGIAVATLGPLLIKTRLLSLIAGAAGIFLLILGGVGLLLGWGLWTGQSWAWWIEVILLALNFVMSIAELPRGIISLVISALLLYYFFKPHVKEFFGVKVPFST